jgi:uncharacterized protein YbaP (TraB family)
MMTKLLQRLFAPVAALLALGAAPTAAKAPAPANPALWAVSDADTTIYLFGTIHLLPPNYQWRTAKFDQAVAGSQQLVVETIVDESNPAQMMSALSSLAFSANLPPIAERVPPNKRPVLEAAIKKSGLPRPSFDRLETWAAAFMLLGDRFRDMGLKTGEGVEQVLRGTFARQGKAVGELESNRMLAAWARGDVEAIARSFNHELSAVPALKDALLNRRNAHWSRWVEQRMSAPGSVMIAVGAGHLAGRDSLVDRLKRSGYKVRRLQ